MPATCQAHGRHEVSRREVSAPGLSAYGASEILAAATREVLMRYAITAAVAAALITAAAGSAANPGDPFKLGVSNAVNASTRLSGSSDIQLRISNSNTAASAASFYGVVPN